MAEAIRKCRILSYSQHSWLACCGEILDLRTLMSGLGIGLKYPFCKHPVLNKNRMMKINLSCLRLPPR